MSQKLCLTSKLLYETFFSGQIIVVDNWRHNLKLRLNLYDIQLQTINLYINMSFGLCYLWSAGCGLRAAGCRLRAAGCGLGAVGCGHVGTRAREHAGTRAREHASTRARGHADRRPGAGQGVCVDRRGGMCAVLCVLCVLCVCCVRACCALCVLCARCVCVLCVCAWQNNQHLENNEMNFQTNCCHQTKKGISLGGWPACMLAGLRQLAPTPTPHPHVCILQNKNQLATLTPTHTCKTHRPLFKLPPWGAPGLVNSIIFLRFHQIRFRF